MEEDGHVDQSVEEVLDKQLRALPRRRYPQAIAVALILRHSWRADDLAWILRRLTRSAVRGVEPSGTIIGCQLGSPLSLRGDNRVG